MTNINPSEAEHLNPAYKIEIAPQQTDANQVSSVKKTNALSVSTVRLSLLSSTRSVYNARSLNLFTQFQQFYSTFSDLFNNAPTISISFPLEHFDNFIYTQGLSVVVVENNLTAIQIMYLRSKVYK